MKVRDLSTLVDSKLVTIKIGRILHSLLMSNVVTNINNVLAFLPGVFVLFLTLTFLRSDKCVTHITCIVRKVVDGLKLSKQTFVPVVLKFNYAIPTVVTSQSLRGQHSHFGIVLVAPFVDYDTHLPVCVLFTRVFFRRHTVLITCSVCLVNLIITVLMTTVVRLVSQEGSRGCLLVRLPRCGTPDTEAITVCM